MNRTCNDVFAGRYEGQTVLDPSEIEFQGTQAGTYVDFTPRTSSIFWSPEACYVGVSGLSGSYSIAVDELSTCNLPFTENAQSTFGSSLRLLIEELGDYYNITENAALREFLYDELHIAYVLKKTYSAILQVFGDKASKIALDLFNDPEENYIGIAIAIHVTASPDEALGLLDKFDHQWWFSVSAEARKIITVDIAL